MKNIRATLLFIAYLLVISVFTASAENIDPASSGCQYAWSENAGWINFKPGFGPGVTVTGTAVTGMAWGENFGWIVLDPVGAGVVNDGLGNLSGYAWSENRGWIDFNPTNGGVKIATDGSFSGYAWGENFGWISFGVANSCLVSGWQKPDTTPDIFSFTALTGVPLNSSQLSNQITVSGINTATAISASVGATYSINNGSYTASAGKVVNGDKVTLQVQSSTMYATSKTATLNIGGTVRPFSVTTMADIVPGAPTDATAFPGDRSATIYFNAPQANGGSAITLYTATSSPGGNTGTSTTVGPITVSNLTPGMPYTFTVTAKNNAGSGPASVASNSILPYLIADGVCGTANGNSYASLPIPDTYCDTPAALLATPVGPGPWTWVCKGSNGGVDATCIANNKTVAYNQTDLIGDWDINVIASGPGAPFWMRGPLTIAANGAFTSTLSKNNGGTDTPSGTITISGEGNVTISPANPDMKCIMSAGKTVISCTSSWSNPADGTRELAVLIKKAATYAQSDLTGTWELNNIDAPGPGWIRGPFIINASGSFTATLTAKDSSTMPFTGAMTINNSGIVTFTSPAMDPTQQSTMRCAMDSAKTFITCTSNKSNGGTANYYLFTKKAATYTQTDIAGIWQINSLTAPTASWSRGMINFGSTGTFSVNLTSSSGENRSATDIYSIGTDGSITFGGTMRCTVDSTISVMACTDTSGTAGDAELFLLARAFSNKPGDCDGSGAVSIAEVQAGINMYLGLMPATVCVDTDGSGSVSIAEVQKVINGYLGL